MYRLLAAMVACAFIATPWAIAESIDLQYNCPPGTKLIREAKETGEFIVIGDVPGVEQLTGTMKGTSKLQMDVGDVEDYYGLVKVTGSRKIEYETDGMPLDPQYDDMGPATLKVTEEGDVIETSLPKFEADAMGITQYAWWTYISKQLNIIDGLPMGPVEVNEGWENKTTIKNPAGGDLTVTTMSQVIGTAWDNGKCAWIASKSVLPLTLKFKTEEGNFEVAGNIEMFAATCFNIDKGFPTSKKTYQIANLALKSKATDDGYGEDFTIQLLAALRSDSKTGTPKAEKKEEAKSTDASDAVAAK